MCRAIFDTHGFRRYLLRDVLTARLYQQIRAFTPGYRCAIRGLLFISPPR